MARIMHQLIVLVAILAALAGAVGGDISLPAGAEGQPLTFGHSLLPLFFHNYTQFNHGAYGGTPRPVLAAQHAYGARMEADIDPWMNSPSGYRACIVAARQAIAALTNATTADGDGAEDIVLVDNATEGVNDVLRNLEPPLGADQWIFDLSTAYAPFAGLYQWLGARVGVRVLTADIVFPVTGADSFLAPVRAALAAANASALDVRIAVISHVAAYPSLLLPVAELVELFHAYGIPVFVDGAHALGNVAIDLGRMGRPEYYVANAHKWLFAPKSAAMLFVRRDRQLAHVPVPSCVDNAEAGIPFTGRFEWTGTRDRTAYCAIADALAFRARLGGEAAIMRYTQTLARDGGRLLVALWGTRLLHPEAMSTSMVSVQVPAATTAACAALRSELCAPPYRVCVSGDGVLDAAHGGIACYWRLSAQVYQELSDWQTLGELTLQLLKKRDALIAPDRTGSEAL